MDVKSRPYTARGWPPERRKAQAARIRRQKPWLRTTGPKTADGKARASQNAYKHGRRSSAYRQQLSILKQLLRLQAKKLAACLLSPSRPLCHVGHRGETLPSLNFPFLPKMTI